MYNNVSYVIKHYENMIIMYCFTYVDCLVIDVWPSYDGNIKECCKNTCIYKISESMVVLLNTMDAICWLM